jgi:hypothetical protein
MPSATSIVQKLSLVLFSLFMANEENLQNTLSVSVSTAIDVSNMESDKKKQSLV